ncbi:MAG: response regulator [Spirochaetales bacterium]|nr:response regulator [Spirochaetales bacterium]
MKRFPRNNLIKTRILIFSAVFFLIIFVGGTTTFFLSMQQIVQNTAVQELERIVETLRIEIETDVADELATTIKMADTPVIKRYFLAPENQRLERYALEELGGYQRALKGHHIIWVSDSDKKLYFNGEYRFTVDPGDPDLDWYNRTLYETETYNFKINYNDTLDKFELWIHAPVFDEGKPIGMVGTGRDLDSLTNTLFSNVDSRITFHLFNNTGEITGARDVGFILGTKHISEYEAGGRIFTVARQLSPGDFQTFIINDTLYTVNNIRWIDWYITASMHIGPSMIFNTPMTAVFLLMMSGILLVIIVFNIFCLNILKDLVKSQQEAESANKAKSGFLAHMSHEIRTPMNAIIGMSELMRTDNLDSEQLFYFDDIKKMSHSLLSIINDILDFSKIEAGKLELVPVHYNIHRVFRNIVSMCQFIAEGKGLKLHTYCAADVPEILYGDQTRIRQIFVNIVNNAVKYTHEGYVDFSLTREERDGKEYLLAAVRDTGVGIKEEDIKNLFESFEQLDKQKNLGIAGTGLGLSITKSLVIMMGGCITVESEYGRGSCFTALLPLIPGDPSKVDKGLRNPVVFSKGNVRVLVVDDMPENLIVARGFLTQRRIIVDTAESGAAALRMIREQALCGQYYDLVFMDHMMPGMDGVEATKQIRRLGDDMALREQGRRIRAMPIIALSANAVTGAIKTFLDGGMNDFLAKPMEASRLNTILAKWLPPEKLIMETSGECRMDQPDLLLQQLGEIENLDVKDGLSHVDCKEGYYQLLRLFCTGLDETIRIISDCVEKSDWTTYAIRTHGIKGVLRMMGQKELGEWAYKLERAGKAGNAPMCAGEAGPFCEALQAFRGKLLATGLFAEKKEPEVTMPALGPLLFPASNC